MNTIDTPISPVAGTLQSLRAEFEDELDSILQYWTRYTVDEIKGGFFGRVDQSNTPDPDAPRGIVQYSRILWAFSAGAQKRPGHPDHLSLAKRAYYYILEHFSDRAFGGVYWSVDASGKMLEGRKQVYGIAFCIYGMAEYYRASRDKQSLHFAKELFQVIEQYSVDRKRGGYLEAFTRGWEDTMDLRLSEKDANECKTLNTHLHVIEAYASLYRSWPDAFLKERIIDLLRIFDKHFISKKNFHLHLFMDKHWRVKSSLLSYGHDIEASWLLLEAAETIDEKAWVQKFRAYSLQLAEGAAEGLDTDGGLWYEFESSSDQLVREKHWWPQAEAIVGFFNAWQLTRQEQHLQQSIASWRFVQNWLIDTTGGEWLWGVNGDYSRMNEDKAGFWKCPYHNSRACLEMINRINQELEK